MTIRRPRRMIHNLPEIAKRMIRLSFYQVLNANGLEYSLKIVKTIINVHLRNCCAYTLSSACS